MSTKTQHRMPGDEECSGGSGRQRRQAQLCDAGRLMARLFRTATGVLTLPPQRRWVAAGSNSSCPPRAADAVRTPAPPLAAAPPTRPAHRAAAAQSIGTLRACTDLLEHPQGACPEPARPALRCASCSRRCSGGSAVRRWRPAGAPAWVPHPDLHAPGQQPMSSLCTPEKVQSGDCTTKGASQASRPPLRTCRRCCPPPRRAMLTTCTGGPRRPAEG